MGCKFGDKIVRVRVVIHVDGRRFCINLQFNVRYSDWHNDVHGIRAVGGNRRTAIVKFVADCPVSSGHCGNGDLCSNRIECGCVMNQFVHLAG